MQLAARGGVAALVSMVVGCAQAPGTVPQAPEPPIAPPPATAPPASPPPASSAPPPAVNLSGFPPEYKRGYGEGCAAARAGASSSNKGSGQYAVGWSDGYRYCARQRP